MPLSFEVADEYFFFDPLSAKIYWKKSPNKHIRTWTIAGSINERGYRKIGLFHKIYQATHIIYLLMTGEWPSSDMDHINRNPLDNHWENLRLATPRQNGANHSKRADNTSGYRGVSWDKKNKKWRVKVGGRYRGLFDDKEAAALHHDILAKQTYGEFANLNFPET